MPKQRGAVPDEFFYVNYIATRTRFVKDTYLKLDGFEVDSELLELLAQRLLRLLPDRLTLIDQIFEKRIYMTLINLL